jgi:hypothetical protein
MALRIVTRKTRMQLFNEEGDVCSLLFSQKRAQRACRLFLAHLKKKGGLTRKEMSVFSWDLDRGRVEPGFRYRRSSFYRQIRKTLLTLGLIAIEQRFGTFEKEFDLKVDGVRDKYVAVRQPISQRPPDGLNLVRLVWIICKRWNDEFLSKDMEA